MGIDRTGGRSVLVAGILTASLALGPVPSAAGDETVGAYPSLDQVEAAQRDVDAATRDVGAIQASLLLANRRLELAAVEAEIATEAYHGARWRLDVAREELAAARREASAARRTVEQQRRSLGAMVAASYQQAGDLTALSALMDAEGPEGVLDRYVTFQGVSERLQADYDRFAASHALAEAFEGRAEAVSARAERLADEARAAQHRAAEAAEAAQATASAVAAEKERLVRELARVQHISVSLARRRQAALEEIARRRAAERARIAAEEAAEEAAAERAAEQAARRDRRAAAERARVLPASPGRATSRTGGDDRADGGEPRTAPRLARETTGTTGTTTPATPPLPASPQPAPAPSLPPPPPSGSGGADQVVAFAMAQLGDPYVWGAAGPDAWDCSGLVLEAWARAGVSLPHYSVAQYHAGTPISSDQLRPGDLVFWGSTSSPESIFHVALYIGDGRIVHAPRTGRPVSVDSLYYWTPPNFFVRV